MKEIIWLGVGLAIGYVIKGCKDENKYLKQELEKKEKANG